MTTTADQQGVFCNAVRVIFERWDALQFAINQNAGGAHTKEMADWFPEAVAGYFFRNKDMQLDEVEELLEDMLNDTFHLVVEDGSLRRVSSQLRRAFSCVGSAELNKLLAEIETKTVHRIQPATPQDESSDDDGDMGEIGSDAGGLSSVLEEMHLSSSSECQSAAQTSGPSNSRSAVQQTDAVGWTLVTPRKKDKSFSMPS